MRTLLIILSEAVFFACVHVPEQQYIHKLAPKNNNK